MNNKKIFLLLFIFILIGLTTNEYLPETNNKGQEIFTKICEKFSFKVEYYTIADFYTFAYIIKPGILKSNKKGPTKMEKIV